MDALPPVAAFVISFFTSMAGLSGAFLLLPFQMSVLGFTSPAVSPTNLVFNLVATPSGVYRYWREGRVVWPLAFLIVAGTIPGVAAGGLIRVAYLPDPRRFKVFVGLVLLGVGVRLLADVWRNCGKTASDPAPEEWHARTLEFTSRSLRFEFRQREYECRPAGILALSLVVGLIGGVYGIGGGAIIAPFLVAFWGLPVHTVAGATLMGTFATSAAGVGFYQAIAVPPDWALGLWFGAGGIAGMYLGARTQRFVPAVLLNAMLALILLGVALFYIGGYFFS
jgi:uncharacterized membrane protein YfcA